MRERRIAVESAVIFALTVTRGLYGAIHVGSRGLLHGRERFASGGPNVSKVSPPVASTWRRLCKDVALRIPP